MAPNEVAFSLDSVPDAILVIDARGRIVSVNQQAEALFGCPREELLERSIEHAVPEGVAEARAAAQSGQTEGRGRANGSIHRDGARFPVALNWQAAAPSGEVYVVLSLREPEWNAEEVSRSSRLRQHVDVFSLFNHDVRQSLQSIQFLCDSLVGTAPETASNISEIVGSVKALLDTILRLNDSGTIRAEEERCVLGELLQVLGRELEPVAQKKGLRLDIEPVEEAIRTDPVLLRELLQNLVANAIRYTDQGVVTVRSRSTPTSVRIDVTDTGIGMEGDQLEGILASARDSVAAVRPRGGFGLGLAIAQRLADVLGGRIDVESIPGEGSTFSVTVPRTGARRDPLRVPPRGAARNESEGH